MCLAGAHILAGAKASGIVRVVLQQREARASSTRSRQFTTILRKRCRKSDTNYGRQHELFLKVATAIRDRNARGWLVKLSREIEKSRVSEQS
jgi:hypothetical protein